MNKSVMFLAAVLSTATCASITDSTPPPDILFSVGDEFSLALGQGATTADSTINIRFNGVPAESRCPSDVVCVWEGYAEVGLTVRVGGSEDAPVLSTNSAVCCTADTIGGFVFEVRALTPIPTTSQTDIPYVVRLLVTPSP